MNVILGDLLGRVSYQFWNYHPRLTPRYGGRFIAWLVASAAQAVTASRCWKVKSFDRSWLSCQVIRYMADGQRWQRAKIVLADPRSILTRRTLCITLLKLGLYVGLLYATHGQDRIAVQAAWLYFFQSNAIYRDRDWVRGRFEWTLKVTWNAVGGATRRKAARNRWVWILPSSYTDLGRRAVNPDYLVVQMQNTKSSALAWTRRDLTINETPGRARRRGSLW